MRINKFVAAATGLSRRVADKAIEQGNVLVNGAPANAGQDITDADEVLLNGKKLSAQEVQTVVFYKPTGYVVSRDGQGSQTIYALLPPELHHLKPVGRLDKDSSGLLLLTSDGQLAQQLTHPKYEKTKVYEVELNKPLSRDDQQQIARGVVLADGPSKLELKQLGSDRSWQVRMHEGRNRQIRRTFTALYYQVTRLHRVSFGEYTLPKNLQPGDYLLT